VGNINNKPDEAALCFTDLQLTKMATDMVMSSSENPYFKTKFYKEKHFVKFLFSLNAYENCQVCVPVMLDIERKTAEIFLILPQIKNSLQKNCRDISENGGCLTTVSTSQIMKNIQLNRRYISDNGQYVAHLPTF
jgi:hypothetical protein